MEKPTKKGTGLSPVSERRAVWMEGSFLCMIDQRLLPHRIRLLRLKNYSECSMAIREMAVRGAGTIGVTAGFAMAQAALTASESEFWEDLGRAAQEIRAARPTAKNLFYAVDRVLAAAKDGSGVAQARGRAVAEAQAIYDDDVRMTEGIARAGSPLIPKEKGVLTHCNAGWLAYPGCGSALGPIFRAHEEGRPLFVYATETRPRSQGAKLTSWELHQAGVPHLLIPDTAAGSMMRQGKIGLVIVGADRIAANGDTANKIGTYSLSVLARAHEIPFYVAAPSPTFDPDCPSGDQIPIEEREEEEVLFVTGLSSDGQEKRVRIAAEGVRAGNPAFDVTPAELITGFLTECGVVAPTSAAIAGFLKTARPLRKNLVESR